MERVTVSAKYQVVLPEHERQRQALYAEIGKLSTQLAWLNASAGMSFSPFVPLPEVKKSRGQAAKLRNTVILWQEHHFKF